MHREDSVLIGRLIVIYSHLSEKRATRTLVSGDAAKVLPEQLLC